MPHTYNTCIISFPNKSTKYNVNTIVSNIFHQDTHTHVQKTNLCLKGLIAF